MYKRNSIKKLGRTTSHRKALIKNQLRSVMQSGKVKTSSAKAKVLKGELESILSRILTTEENDLVLTRDLLVMFGNKQLANKAIEMGKKKTTKVSIKKIGYRAGDNTQMSTVEIVGFKTKAKPKTSKKEDKKVKEVEKEETKELPMEDDHKKGILNIGKKRIKENVGPVKKERAKSRSGI